MLTLAFVTVVVAADRPRYSGAEIIGQGTGQTSATQGEAAAAQVSGGTGLAWMQGASQFQVRLNPAAMSVPMKGATALEFAQNTVNLSKDVSFVSFDGRTNLFG